MAWAISYTARARRQLDKLDRQWRKQIVDYLSLEIANQPDPRQRGHGLTGDRSGIWRFRLGDYRILCEVRANELLVLVVEVGHRSSVYR